MLVDRHTGRYVTGEVDRYIILLGSFLSYLNLPLLVPNEVSFCMTEVCSGPFRYPLKSVPVPIEVCFGIYVGLFR